MAISEKPEKATIWQKDQTVIINGIVLARKRI